MATSEKRTFWRLGVGHLWCIFESRQEAEEDAENNMEPGDKPKIESVQMTQVEYDALPDFQGW